MITVKFAKVAVHTEPVQSHSSAIVRSFGVVKIARLISTFAAIVLVKTAHDVTTSMAISVAHVPPASLVSLVQLSNFVSFNLKYFLEIYLAVHLILVFV